MEIRTKLSKMSFENLQKLKEKLGGNVYNDTMFGIQEAIKVNFKQKSKNRPREMSAKKQVSKLEGVIHVKKTMPRDPRFDSFCGHFNEKAFNTSYNFLYELKKNDLMTLKTELKKNAKDSETAKKIKYLIQRLKNQLREANRKKQEEEQQQKSKQESVQSGQNGGRANLTTKSGMNILELVSQYEELKTSGRLKKHIKRNLKKKI